MFCYNTGYQNSSEASENAAEGKMSRGRDR